MAAKKTTGYDYSALLARARSDLPEELNHEGRWTVPEPEILHEGRTTILRNWKEITDTLRRDPQHVISYLLRELGTAGDAEADRAIFNGKIGERALKDKLNAYIDTFVRCDECQSPDTHLDKDGRTQLLKCDACGAHRPVRVRKRRETES